MSEHYLVVGGNGYIGQHMCKYLTLKGHKVYIVDDHSTSPKVPMHSYGEFYPLDLGDQNKVRKCLKELPPMHAVYLFANRALVPEGEQDPFSYYNHNVIKTIHFFQLLQEFSIRHIIFSSTCAVYGNPVQTAINEDHPLNPISTYGMTKLLIENILRDLASKKIFKALFFRYFNAAGCSPDGELGENHDPETHLIPNLCKAAISGNLKSFQLFGTDYPTRDGTCIRDYIHVDDLAKVHYQGLRYLEEGCLDFDMFNLGSEQGHSVLEVLNRFQDIAEVKLDVKYLPRRAGDPPNLIANSQKAKEKLGFSCSYSLDDCIKHTLNWQQNNQIKHLRANEVL